MLETLISSETATREFVLLSSTLDGTGIVRKSEDNFQNVFSLGLHFAVLERLEAVGVAVHQVVSRGVLGVAQQMNAAVVAVGLLDNRNLAEAEVEAVKLFNEEVEELLGQQSGVEIVHAVGRVQMKEFSGLT